MDNEHTLPDKNRMRDALLALLNNSPFPDEECVYDLLSKGTLEIKETSNKPSDINNGRDGIAVTLRVSPQLFTEYADEIHDFETVLGNRSNDLIPEKYGCEVQYAEIVPSIEDNNVISGEDEDNKKLEKQNLNAVMSNNEPLAVGDKIGNYTVTEVLPGGMSEVYRVIDEKGEGNKRYVLKRAKVGSSPDEIKLFKREIRILRSLHNPNIIEVLNADTDADLPYYVMPSCGKSFAKLTNNISELEKTRYAITFCKAIQYAHEQGVYHRDIKPQNVLLYDGVVKVADFGLSRFVNRDTTTITKTGTSAGTAGYMPPEFSSGQFKEGTVESDIYMVGKTLYYLFSGGKDVSNIRSEFVQPLIYEIVDRCTRNEPKERYSSLEPVINRLTEYAKALEDEQNAPKSIKEIKILYAANTPQFNEEVYKTLRASNRESMMWGDEIRELKDSELKSVFLYKRDYLNDFAGHFMECLTNPNDNVQFSDIDEFARVVKILVALINDTAIKQNLIQFLANISIGYNRYPSMEILAEIANGLSEDDFKRMRVFFIMNKNMFNKIRETLGRDNIFNNRISQLL